MLCQSPGNKIIVPYANPASYQFSVFFFTFSLDYDFFQSVFYMLSLVKGKESFFIKDPGKKNFETVN